MNLAPSGYDWGMLFVLIALSAATIAVVAAAVAWFARSAAWSRMVWRAAVVSSFVVLGGEMTGIAGGISRWAIARAAALGSPTISDSGDRLAVVPLQAIDPATSSLAWTEMELEGLLEPLPPTLRVDPGGDGASTGPSWRDWISDLGQRRTWWPGIVWGVVAAVLLARTVAGRLLLVAWRRRAEPHTIGELSHRVDTLSRHFDLRAVRVVEIPGIRGPVAFGIIRPTIGVPPRFTLDFDTAQQSAMLAHELEHLASRDPLWHFLADVAAAITWWDPLVWWMRWRLRAASEWAADEASQIVPNGPEVLARCLVRIGRQMLRADRPAWLAIQGNGFRSGLGRRVSRLLNLEDQPWRRARGPAMISGRVLITAALVLASLLSTSWLSLDDTLKGDSMQVALHQSWRQSLAAATLFGVFGVGDLSSARAMLVDMPEPTVTASEPQKSPDDPHKEATEKHARAIAEKLKAMHHQMVELKEAGRLDELEQLSRESRELKAMLEKLGDLGGKDDPAVLRKKISADSADALRERLEQLEAENMKLRRALEEFKQKAATSDKSREDVDRARKELHEKILKTYHDQLGDDPKAQAVYEKLVRDQELRAKLDESAAKSKEMVTLREKIERLSEEQAKLVEKGRGEEADKLKLQIRELMEMAEKSKARFGGDSKGQPQKTKSDDEKPFKSKGEIQGPQTQEFVAMLKELREEVSRLRNEVTEIRQMVKEGGGKDQKSIR